MRTTRKRSPPTSTASWACARPAAPQPGHFVSSAVASTTEAVATSIAAMEFAAAAAELYEQKKACPATDVMSRWIEVEKETGGEVWAAPFGLDEIISDCLLLLDGGAETTRTVIARTILELAERLGRPPVLSYASYALDNWRRIDPDGPVALGNLALLQNFLGGADEDWFILVHVEIEARAAAALDHDLLSRLGAGDSTRGSGPSVAGLIERVHDLLQQTLRSDLVLSAEAPATDHAVAGYRLDSESLLIGAIHALADRCPGRGRIRIWGDAEGDTIVIRIEAQPAETSAVTSWQADPGENSLDPADLHALAAHCDGSLELDETADSLALLVRLPLSR